MTTHKRIPRRLKKKPKNEPKYQNVKATVKLADLLVRREE